jgi:hypothetical protein
MGGMGRCCCTCECLPIEDLPTVTISGYTGGGWSGNCCYQQTFTPNSVPSWSKNCSGLLYDSTSTANCVTQHYAVLTPNYRGYEISPGGCDTLPEDFCCPEGVEHVATTTTDVERKASAFFALWRRPKHIIVRISQEEVDCEDVEGQTGGCKIVIRSRFVYDAVSMIFQHRSTKIDQSVEMINTTCFELDDRYIVDVNPDPAPTCDDIPNDPDNVSTVNCKQSATFYFDRVQYFAEMPSGDVEFENEDVPGCEASSCNYEPYNYASSVCVFGPTQEIRDYSSSVYDGPCEFTPPCHCFESVVELPSSASFPDLQCSLDFANVRTGCFSDPCSVPACAALTGDVCINPGDPVPVFDCPELLETNGFEYVCPTPFREVDGDASGCNEITNDESGQLRYSGCGCSSSLSPNQLESIRPFFDTSDCFEGNCSGDCCREFDDCPCCPSECVPKYSDQAVPVITSHSLTQTCSGITSQSVCTGAPSWTINLS